MICEVNYFTFVESSAPGLNLTTFFALIVISLPVCGLRPLRAERSETENDPNPTRATRSPFLSADEVVSMNASSARFASALEIPAPSAIDSTNSALFILSIF